MQRHHAACLFVLILTVGLVAKSNAQIGPGPLDLDSPAVRKAVASNLQPPIAGKDSGSGDPILRFSNSREGGSSGMALPLEVSTWQGSWLTVDLEVSAQSVSPKAQPWNGIKVMAKLEGTSTEWPQLSVGTGTFGWTRYHGRMYVPSTTRTLTLILGVEASTGTASMRRIVLGREDLPPLPPAADPGKAVFTGHGPGNLRGAMIRPDLSRADFDTLTRQWGANLVRWQLIRGVGAPVDPASWNAWLDTMLAKFDQALVWARENGVLLVLDLHSPPGGGDSIGGYQDASGGLFTDPQAQDRFVAAWELMARRYRGNPQIWGFDLANEPEDSGVQPPCLDWQALALRAARAIRAIDPGRTLIVEPSGMGNPAAFERFRPLPLEGVVYSIHWYAPGTYTHQGIFTQGPALSYPGIIEGEYWNRDRLRQGLGPALEFAQRYRVRIYVGEFGAVRWAPGNERYLTDLVSLFEEYGWDWSFHAFREWHGWSIEHGPHRQDESPKGVKGPRPQAIIGAFRLNHLPQEATAP